MVDIPTGVRLTSYSGGSGDVTPATQQRVVDQVADGTLVLPLGRVFPFEALVEAHRVMDANTGGGKLVVVIGSGRSDG